MIGTCQFEWTVIISCTFWYWWWYRNCWNCYLFVDYMSCFKKNVEEIDMLTTCALNVRVANIMSWTRAYRVVIICVTDCIPTTRIDSASLYTASSDTSFDIITFWIRFTFNRNWKKNYCKDSCSFFHSYKILLWKRNTYRFAVTIVAGNGIWWTYTHYRSNWICVQNCTFLIWWANTSLSTWVLTFLINTSQFRWTFGIFITFWCWWLSRFYKISSVC